MSFRQFPKIADGEMPIEPQTKVNNGLAGKLNVVGEVTLDAGAASTTLEDPLINPDSHLLMTPRTANAQAITWRQGATTAGQIVIEHTNDANADKTFRYSILG